MTKRNASVVAIEAIAPEVKSIIVKVLNVVPTHSDKGYTIGVRHADGTIDKLYVNEAVSGFKYMDQTFLDRLMVKERVLITVEVQIKDRTCYTDKGGMVYTHNSDGLILKTVSDIDMETALIERATQVGMAAKLSGIELASFIMMQVNNLK